MLYNTPKGDINIRPSENNDQSSLVNIDLKSYDLQWDAGTWKCMSADTHVAEVDGRVVGFCVSQTNGNIIHILKLAVTPAFRRMKIGSSLMFDACLRHLDKSFVSITVGASQVEALEFIKRHDFKLNGEFDEYPAWPAKERGFFYLGRIIR